MPQMRKSAGKIMTKKKGIRTKDGHIMKAMIMPKSNRGIAVIS
jgi:hypothetical protein